MVELWTIVVFAGSMMTPKFASVWNWVGLRICDPLNSHTTDAILGSMQVYVTLSAELKAMNWSFGGSTVGGSGRSKGEREGKEEEEEKRERGRERRCVSEHGQHTHTTRHLGIQCVGVVHGHIKVQRACP